MSIQSIGIVGAGQMGAGIAQTAAMNGFEVVLHDTKSEFTDRGLKSIESSLDRFIKKETITQSEKKDILDRISLTTKLSDLKNTQLVIEAATENPQIKFNIFKELDALVPKDTILASNTSSISITQIAGQTNRPENVIGMHFMNPVPVMKLVEMIRGLLTSDACCVAVSQVAQKMKKETVEVKDFPGFLVNRILCPMINEAVFALESNIASAKDIDTAMKLGTHQPMGPLELADFIGLDTCLSIMEVLHEGLGEDKFRPAPLLRKYVQAGLLGKKTGKGFYNY